MKTYKDVCNKILNANSDLKKHQRKKIISLIIKFFIIEALVIALTVYLISFTEIAILLGIIMAIFLPIVLLKPQKALISKMYGKIIKVHKDWRRVSRNNWVVRYQSDLHHRNFMVYTVQNSNGKEWTFETTEAYEQVFNLDDEVIRLPAINYPINLTPAYYILCPICGNIMPKESEHCVSCGASPITVEFNT